MSLIVQLGKMMAKTTDSYDQYTKLSYQSHLEIEPVTYLNVGFYYCVIHNKPQKSMDSRAGYSVQVGEEEVR